MEWERALAEAIEGGDERAVVNARRHAQWCEAVRGESTRKVYLNGRLRRHTPAFAASRSRGLARQRELVCKMARDRKLRPAARAFLLLLQGADAFRLARRHAAARPPPKSPSAAAAAAWRRRRQSIEARRLQSAPDATATTRPARPGRETAARAPSCNTPAARITAMRPRTCDTSCDASWNAGACGALLAPCRGSTSGGRRRTRPRTPRSRLVGELRRRPAAAATWAARLTSLDGAGSTRAATARSCVRLQLRHGLPKPGSSARARRSASCDGDHAVSRDLPAVTQPISRRSRVTPPVAPMHGAGARRPMVRLRRRAAAGAGLCAKHAHLPPPRATDHASALGGGVPAAA